MIEIDLYPPQPEPIRAEIEVTNVCNAKCVFCPRWNMKRQKGFLDLGRFSDFLERLDKYRRSMWLNEPCGTIKFPRLVFAGLGEPTLHPGILEIISEGNSRGFEIELVTNGTILNPDLVQGFAEAGLNNLAISLHSLDPETYYRFTGLRVDKVIPRIAETLKILDDTNVNVEIWRVSSPNGSMPERCKENRKIRRFLAQFKKNIKILGPTPAWNRGGQLPNTYWPKVHDSDKIWCQLLYLTLNVAWDGKAVLCCCDYSEITVPLGSAWEESIQILQRRRHEVFKNPFKENICQKCRRPRDQTYENTVFPILKKTTTPFGN